MCWCHQKVVYSLMDHPVVSVDVHLSNQDPPSAFVIITGYIPRLFIQNLFSLPNMICILGWIMSGSGLSELIPATVQVEVDIMGEMMKATVLEGPPVKTQPIRERQEQGAKKWWVPSEQNPIGSFQEFHSHSTQFSNEDCTGWLWWSRTYLGWVDYDFGHSAVCLVLLGPLGIWQNRLVNRARWWNIKIQSTQPR